jgi:hypothetical protein
VAGVAAFPDLDAFRRELHRESSPHTAALVERLHRTHALDRAPGLLGDGIRLAKAGPAFFGSTGT